MNSVFRQEVIEFLSVASHGKKMVFNVETTAGTIADVLIPEIDCAIIFHFIGEKHTKEDQEIKSGKLKTVHLWEDQWVYDKEKIKSKLNSLLRNTHKIHGRQTKTAKIDNAQLMDFLTTNHLNVPIKGKHKYGLIHESELVAVMSFSKGRKFMRDGIVYNSFELIRFCNKLNTTVVGGFSKLLNHFIKTHNPEDIMTYIDADWSDGHSLSNFKFELIGKVSTVIFWLDTKTGVRGYPHILLKKYSKSMDDISTISAKQTFLDFHGFIEVYNSGSYKYLMKRK